MFSLSDAPIWVDPSRLLSIKELFQNDQEIAMILKISKSTVEIHQFDYVTRFVVWPLRQSNPNYSNRLSFCIEFAT